MKINEKQIDKIVGEIFDFYGSAENSSFFETFPVPLNVYDVQYLIYCASGYVNNGSRIAISKRLIKYFKNKEREYEEELRERRIQYKLKKEKLKNGK